MSRRERLHQLRSSISRYGFVQHLLHRLAFKRWRAIGWNAARALADAERRFFPDTEMNYARDAAAVARTVDDINSDASVSLMSSLHPDVVVCSGGPIYKRPLIEACGLMLNYHTGISPLYNGAYTAYWPFANKQPHATGGTLMKMSPVVDGGDILAHYLPPIEPGDDPATLFMKSIRGGVELYKRFIEDRRKGRPFVSVPQGKPFFYCYGHEWTVYQTLTVQRELSKRALRSRPELIAEYWRCKDAEAAKQAVIKTVIDLIWRDDQHQ